MGKRIDFIHDDKVSKVSDFTKYSCCYRCGVISIVMTWTILVSALIGVHIYFDEEDLKNNMMGYHEVLESPFLYLLYLPVLNFLFVLIVGRYVLIGCIYPYQNSIIRE